MNQFERAQYIARTLGTYKAARYLRNKGWSLDMALNILARAPQIKKGVRHG